MAPFIKLHLRENLRKNAFILFVVLGVLVTAVFFSAGTFSVNNSMVDSDYAQYAYQWTMLTVLASLGSIALSMGNVEKQRIGSRSELLRLHGLSLEGQYWGIVIGNVLTGMTVAMILLTGLIVSIFVKGPDIRLVGFFGALGIYLLSILTTGLVISVFTFLFPPAVAALVGILFVILGSLKGLLVTLTKNMGGLFGSVSGIFLHAVPDINGFGRMAGDVFFSEGLDAHQFFGRLLYLWILTGIVYLTVKGVAIHEK